LDVEGVACAVLDTVFYVRWLCILVLRAVLQAQQWQCAGVDLLVTGVCHTNLIDVPDTTYCTISTKGSGTVWSYFVRIAIQKNI
jgi:hypothetical protein